MPSIQAQLLTQPLPLAEVAGGVQAQPKPPIPDSEKAAKDFEGVFMSMMLKEMRQTLEKGSMFGEDSSDIFGGMFDQFIGQHMAESGGMGMARMVKDSLDGYQGAGSAIPSMPSALPPVVQ